MTIKGIILFITQWIVFVGGIYLISKDASPDDGGFLVRILAIIGFLVIYYHLLVRWWMNLGLKEEEKWKVEEETENE